MKQPNFLPHYVTNDCGVVLRTDHIQGREESSLVTMESKLLYIDVLMEWLLTTQVSRSTLLLAGRCEATMPPLLVAAEVRFVVVVVGAINWSSPSSTMRSSSKSDMPVVCQLHTAQHSTYCKRPTINYWIKHKHFYFLNSESLPENTVGWRW